MEIYSPKLQKQVNFNKNTLKNDSDFLKKNQDKIFITSEEETKNTVTNDKNGVNILYKFDILKNRFYERLKLFFEYDEKSNDGITIKQNW